MYGSVTVGIDTERLKSGTDLRDIVERYVETRRYSSVEDHGPCPWCGGDDRFVVKACNFFCRPGDGHCGRKGDAIDFMMLMHNVGFREACKMLDGTIDTEPLAKLQPEKKERRVREIEWDEGYQSERLRKEQTALRLATEGQEYLSGRGLTPETWAAFGLGYVPRVSLPNTRRDDGSYSYPRQPAIVLPWYKDGHLVAVRYRFLTNHFYTDRDGRECKGEKNKGTRMKGYGPTSGNVFGTQAVPSFCGKPLDGGTGALSLRTLIICEGEFNAMSIWQAASASAVDAISIGSESASAPEWLIELASRYGTVIMWVDRLEVAQKLQRALPGAFAVTSEMCGGNDANDLLRGHLGGYLTAWRYQAAKIADSRGRGEPVMAKRLLYQLMDAADMKKLDGGSHQVMGRIAQVEGLK